VLRGATLSPLHPAGPTSDLPSSWAASDENARVLARALVADALGALVRCPVCRRERTCTDCSGSGLNETGRQVADALAEDVVVRLPAGGFELPAGEIQAWLHRRIATSAAASHDVAPLATRAIPSDTSTDALSAQRPALPPRPPSGRRVPVGKAREPPAWRPPGQQGEGDVVELEVLADAGDRQLSGRGGRKHHGGAEVHRVFSFVAALSQRPVREGFDGRT